MSELPGVVVSVHGLWMTGLESLILRQRLARAGFPVEQFHYHSTAGEPSAGQVVERLHATVLALAATHSVSMLGHSLGGLLILRLLDQYPDLPIRRTLLLGSPVNGSQAARSFQNLPGASWFFGGIAEDELMYTGQRRWRGPGEVGVIAGTNSVGLSRLISTLALPNDGTVALQETALMDATATCVLPVSHLGMLMSSEVADAAVSFLSQGRFVKAA